MTLHRRRFLNLAACAATLPAVSRMARAQTYPARPVRLIVTTPGPAESKRLLTEAAHYYRTGRLAAAAGRYGLVLRKQPRNVDALHMLALLRHRQGMHVEARLLVTKAMKLMPASAITWSNLGVTLGLMRRAREAIACHRRALQMVPRYRKAHFNLATALTRAKKYEEAVDCYRSAVRLWPDYAEAHRALGSVLWGQRRTDDALTSYQRAIESRPDYAAAHQSLLFHMNYLALDLATVGVAHKRWAACCCPAVETLDLDFSNNPDPERRIRVGYVSGDFRRHSAACFMEPLLAAHDHRMIEVLCYNFAPSGHEDTTTERLKACADHWVPIDKLNATDAARRIRSDCIDILVDLGGHTSGGWLDIFALKPAPIQVSWLGYANTTGLATIDYRVTDTIADPHGEGDDFYSEALIRLNRCFLCYRPLDDARPVNSLPSIKEGYITFGCFNTLDKITAEVLQLWAIIMRAVPSSRLLLKSNLHACQRKWVIDLLADEGVNGGRIAVSEWLNGDDDHLALYGRVDIALDPFPYNGTTTTCESLHMGVPVVTLRGDRHAGRVGASLLTAIGLAELIAEDQDGYVTIATGLARDPTRLAHLRSGLRARMLASPLCDARDFARAMEGFYRNAWRHWVRESREA
jgi:predicted O-linked N-acetylglucosamine transferase (SPINDLY family)